MIRPFNYGEMDTKLYFALIQMIKDDPDNYTALIELGRLMFKLELKDYERD